MAPYPGGDERRVNRDAGAVHTLIRGAPLADPMDDDLDRMDRAALLAEARRLRAGIRRHRDSSGQDLCWHHPDLWGLLPEGPAAMPTVPDWPEFLEGCVRYRRSLDRDLPAAPRTRDTT